MVGQGETGQEAGFQISAAFSEVLNVIFCVLPPTLKNLSLSLCPGFGRDRVHLGVTASACAGGH